MFASANGAASRIDPSYNTVVTITGEAERRYTIDVPSRVAKR